MAIRPVAWVVGILVVAGCSSAARGSGSPDVGAIKVSATQALPVTGTTSLSPDGTRILNASNDRACVSEPAGTHKVCVDAKVRPDLQYAAWSPDGSRVAFTDDLFRLTIEPDGGSVWLQFTGPPGTREFLAGMLDL